MEPLLPDNYYHIFNHSNGNDDLFREDKNYKFFLEKYKKHIAPIAETYTYCLMPNHFHFLVRIKNDVTIHFQNKEVKNKFNKLKTYPDRDEFISVYSSKQFANLFSSYTQAFNKEYSRRGSLFLKNFKRKEITDDKYFLRLINYIHFNPVTHGFSREPKDWTFSSYNSILSNQPTLVKRQEVLDWFDGPDNFIANHQYPLDI